MPTLTILSRDAAQYQSYIEHSKIADLTVFAFEKPKQLNAQSYNAEVLLADPGLVIDELDKFEQLRWMQSTWAGNAPLLKHRKNDYKLTGIKGVFGDYMREFVFSYLLYFSRNIESFNKNQADKNWQAPTFHQLKGKTLGILGVGSIGSSVAETAKHFGMRVIGMARTPKAVANIDKIYTPAQKLSLAQEVDYVVSLLPETPDTKHLIDKAFIENLSPSAVVMNAGRGSVIDDNALVDALREKRLKAAVLDVFEQEPLSKEHPYWSLENAFVTCHTAAISYPKDICEIFYQNYQRFVKSEPLMYELSFERGY